MPATINPKPARERSAKTPLYEPSPSLATRRPRAGRKLAKTCTPRNSTRPAISQNMIPPPFESAPSARLHDGVAYQDADAEDQQHQSAPGDPHFRFLHAGVDLQADSRHHQRRRTDFFQHQ